MRLSQIEPHYCTWYCNNLTRLGDQAQSLEWRSSERYLRRCLRASGSVLARPCSADTWDKSGGSSLCLKYFQFEYWIWTPWWRDSVRLDLKEVRLTWLVKCWGEEDSSLGHFSSNNSLHQDWNTSVERNVLDLSQSVSWWKLVWPGQYYIILGSE